MAIMVYYQMGIVEYKERKMSWAGARVQMNVNQEFKETNEM